METPWKVLRLCLGLLSCELCNGLPINLENTVADSHTQLLTGLVAVLLTVCSVVLLAGCLCCQRRNGFKEFRDSPVVASAASNLDHGHINPVANGEFTIFTPLSPPHQNNNVFLANQQIITRTQEDYGYGDVDVSSWFNGTDTDFPRIKLKYIREIGNGWFGRVVEGAAQDINPEQKWTPVVVRILEATASSRERVVFLHDASIYRCGNHPNILRLMGRCLDTIPLLLLQEFCPQGDLKKYLRQNRPTSDKLLLSEFPLLWCCQLTSALRHLHDHKLAHPDLAARNCQLTSNLTLKLGDYGLAVFQYPGDYYQGAPGVPVRWCAPESLSYTSTTIQPEKITLEANIWSLAVTMWEICECGEQPYANLTDDEVVAQVLGASGVRLGRPTSQVVYTDYMFRLMQLCWTNNESRPAVAQIDLMLADLLQVYKNTKSSQEDCHVSIGDFDKRWELFKPNSIVKTDNHVVESAELGMDDAEMLVSKPLSPSLNNLHGSLDNLLVENSEPQMESWLENVATKTGDMSYVKGLSDAIKDLDNALALENGSSSDSSHQQSPAPECLKPKPRIEFKLGPVYSRVQSEDSPIQNDSLTDSTLFMQRNSSGSETEEENWKKKIERGAYTEKVRQKSRSVADLMILTHIDQSESESETPLPSLDYRINYKNVRYAPKQNLENVSYMFGSEGNLLSVQDTFQEELKKLQDERKDSLLFVPENRSQSSDNISDSARNDVVNANILQSTVSSSSSSNNNYLEDSPSKRLMQELNSTSEIKPVNQVFNVFNVTIDKFSPVHLNPVKLNELIHFKESSSVEQEDELYEVPKLSDIIQSNSALVDYLTTNPEPCRIEESYCMDKSNETLYDSGVEDGKAEHSPDNESVKSGCEEQQPAEAFNDVLIHNHVEDKDEITVTPGEDCTVDNVHIKSPTETEPSTSEILFNVPKLVDLIQDNDELMDYIIAKYETDGVDKTNDNDNIEVVELEPVQENIREHEGIEKDAMTKTKEFLSEETKNYYDFRVGGEVKPSVTFDLSQHQDEAMPNSLTHSSVFTSTPFSKRSIQEISMPLSHQDAFSSLNLFDTAPTPEGVENQKVSENHNNLYSLETWDNFLGKALDIQNESQENGFFDSFTSEPQSLLFIEQDNNASGDSLGSNANDDKISDIDIRPDATYVCNERKNSTFDAESNVVDVNDINLEVGDLDLKREETGGSSSTWESSGGWFLHPQSNQNDVTGEITPSVSTDSYVGFNMDDEIMAAIRNELLNKLPQAQGCISGVVHDDDDWETMERNEVFLRYNVYNTPLSPIPEESLIESTSCEEDTPRQEQSDDEDSDWSEHCEEPEIHHDTESHSAHTLESPMRGPHHRHTPSQDSCCSNDTLFNLEELTCAINDGERDSNSPTSRPAKDESQDNEERSFVKQTPNDTVTHVNINSESKKDEQHTAESRSNEIIVSLDMEEGQVVISEVGECGVIEGVVSEEVDGSLSDRTYIMDFLTNERECSCVKITEASGESSSESPSSTTDNLSPYVQKQVAPLPSPEDKPWKQLAESLLTYNKLLPPSETSDIVPESQDLPEKEVVESLYAAVDGGQVHSHDYVDVDEKETLLEYVNSSNKSDSKEYVNIEGEANSPDYVNVDGTESHDYENLGTTENIDCYESVTDISDIYNEADYVNIVNLENTKNSAEFGASKNVSNVIGGGGDDGRRSPDYVNNFDPCNTLIIDSESADNHGVFGVLTDIRFSGPSDTQLMTTSFSESNDLNDEQDWDSGSDTRSSSSGEFIWKEGEHEESLKALRAAPQDVLEDIKPMEGIQEETSSESSCSEEEGESPEFVPSAWDKYATPTKSAMRSPEKTLEKNEKKKSKGVWFKKQKYHCVYEYPREPDSPVLHSYDLWKPQQDFSSFSDWELDATDSFIPPVESSDDTDILKNYQPKSNRNLNLYQLSTIPDFASSGMDDEFFISSSARPFDKIGSGISSQFFPGNWTDASKQPENMTPDSGVEDITPAGTTDSDFADKLMPQIRIVRPLKVLASDVVNRSKKVEGVLGGLRHTRNKLKLDLPPSPSAFTSSKIFNLEPILDPVINREKPTFTTFGKSRFLVQHVDTPPDEATQCKNVSFEALPYKPLQKQLLKEDFDLDRSKKGKVEIVRGEASLLDSADEDSGIESSTLERKLSSSID